MLYRVTFLLAGEERTELIDADDAAAAVARVQFDHGRGDDQFELMSIQIVSGDQTDEEELND